METIFIWNDQNCLYSVWNKFVYNFCYLIWGRNQPIVFLCPTCIKSIYTFSIWKPILWIKSDTFFVLMCCKPINCMNAQKFFIISNNFIIDWPIIHICQTTQSVSFFIFCLRLSTRIDSNIIFWARFKNFNNNVLQIRYCQSVKL